MQIFQNFDGATFKLNGKKFVKNFVVMPINSDAVAIYNAYDTRMQLLPATQFSEVSVNGSTFASQQLLIDALAPILFVKQIIDSASLSGIVTSVNSAVGDVSIGLQQVTDINATTTNPIFINDGLGVAMYGGYGADWGEENGQFEGVARPYEYSTKDLNENKSYFVNAFYGLGLFNQSIAKIGSIKGDLLADNVTFQMPNEAGDRTLATREWVSGFTSSGSTTLQEVLANGNEAVDSVILMSSAESPYTSYWSNEGVTFSTGGDELCIVNPVGLAATDGSNSKTVNVLKDSIEFHHNISGITGVLHIRCETPANGANLTQSFRSKSGYVATETFVLAAVSGVTSASTASISSLSAITAAHTIAINDAVATLETKADNLKQIKVISGTTYSLLNTDVNKILHFTSPSAVTCTIASGMTANSRFEGKQLGAGQITFSPTGTTVRTASTELPKTAEQYSVFAIDWINTNEYMVYGRLQQT